MTALRPFRSGDTPWTLFGLAFGAFFGAAAILLLLLLRGLITGGDA